MNDMRKRQHKGFTIVELAVVIVLLGIMSVTVAPRLLGKSEFSAIATANQYIAHLRLVQLKAMNHRGVCHNSVFQTISGDLVFGIPSNTTTTCGTTTESSTRNIVDGSTITLVNGSTNATIKTSPTIVFDSDGIPTTGGDCSGACKFKVSASTDAYVCIESQGYIHRVESSYVCT